MKKLFKSAKVVYDAHQHEYQVFYRNWFVWHFDSAYGFDTNPSRPVKYRNQEKAEQMAIDRARALLETVEVWRG